MDKVTFLCLEISIVFSHKYRKHNNSQNIDFKVEVNIEWIQEYVNLNRLYSDIK